MKAMNTFSVVLAVAVGLLLTACKNPTNTPGGCSGYTLTVTSSPAHGGTTSVAGSNCYDRGTIVSVTAMPNPGYMFVGWSGASSDTDTTVAMMMDDNKTITANFRRVYTLTVNATNGGTVSRDPIKDFYDYRDTVTITATPDSCSTFIGWSGTFVSMDTAITVTMNGDTVTMNEASVTTSRNIIMVANFLIRGCSAMSGDTLTDSDGQAYHTVVIGGKRWMAENLNYGIDDTIIIWMFEWRSYGNEDSRHYDNDPANSETYGRLYTWWAAKRACPIGWHLPAREEWQALIGAVGGDAVAGKKLKATSRWNDGGNGTDDYGFAALPSGYYTPPLPDNQGDRFYGIGASGHWWSTSEYENSGAFPSGSHWYMSSGDDRVADANGLVMYFSVRCVKN
jgi:uncharacterized protein (TIGR02145 family)/uncharacterized repeat protein (TIGR02543 family)